MTQFTERNTDGFTRMELQRLNDGYEAAFSAIERRARRRGEIEHFDYTSVRQQLVDAVNHLFANGPREFSTGSIARDALTALGYKITVLDWPEGRHPIGHIELE